MALEREIKLRFENAQQARERVVAMGGFTGRETVIAPSRLAAIVRSGEARWFLLGATRSFTGQVNPSIALIESACAPAGTYGGSTLYDCAGAADAIGGSYGATGSP